MKPKTKTKAAAARVKRSIIKDLKKVDRAFNEELSDQNKRAWALSRSAPPIPHVTAEFPFVPEVINRAIHVHPHLVQVWNGAEIPILTIHYNPIAGKEHDALLYEAAQALAEKWKCPVRVFDAAEKEQKP